MVVGIGNKAPGWRPTSALETRILEVLWWNASDTWEGDAGTGGVPTGGIADRLKIRPQTPERNELNRTLTDMRRAGLLHYEMAFGPLRWWRINQLN